MNAPYDPQVTGEAGNLSCLVLKTGRDDCYARFYPALYQLDLQVDGKREKVDLGFSGSRLLERLLLEPGEVVSREALMSHAWSDRVVGQGSLNQQIYTLRQVLADEKKRQIIQTLPRRGYLFNPQFLLTQVPANEPVVEAEESEAPPATPPVAMKRTATWPLLALALLALLGINVAQYIHRIGLQSELARSHAQVGKLHVEYIDEKQQVLPELSKATQGLTTRMATLAKRPVDVVIAMTTGFFEVFCRQPDGGMRTLTVNRKRIDDLTDQMLLECLP